MDSDDERPVAATSSFYPTLREFCSIATPTVNSLLFLGLILMILGTYPFPLGYIIHFSFPNGMKTTFDVWIAGVLSLCVFTIITILMAMVIGCICECSAEWRAARRRTLLF